jgi:hypothetical protein
MRVNGLEKLFHDSFAGGAKQRFAVGAETKLWSAFFSHCFSFLSLIYALVQPSSSNEKLEVNTKIDDTKKKYILPANK